MLQKNPFERSRVCLLVADSNISFLIESLLGGMELVLGNSKTPICFDPRERGEGDLECLRQIGRNTNYPRQLNTV
jgi:hypothetical protein